MTLGGKGDERGSSATVTRNPEAAGENTKRKGRRLPLKRSVKQAVGREKSRPWKKF